MWSHSVRRGCSPSHSRSVQTRVRVLKTVKPPWDRDDTSTVTANSCVSVCVCVCVSSVKLTPASNLNCGHVTAALWLAAGGHVCPKLQTHNINCVQPTHTDIHAHARRHKCTHTNTHTHTHTHTHTQWHHSDGLIQLIHLVCLPIGQFYCSDQWKLPLVLHPVPEPSHQTGP